MRIIDGKAMDRAQLPLNALRAFEAAARHLNFTRAAIELCVSQGAVSHQVAQLERRLGTRLFLRLPRGLALTDDGLYVTDDADRVRSTMAGLLTLTMARLTTRTHHLEATQPGRGHLHSKYTHSK